MGSAKATNILGISAYYHDSAAALLKDGELVAATQQERFSRKNAMDSTSSNGAEPITAGLEEMLAEIRTAYDTKTPIMGLSTGFTDLDTMLTGMWNGQLILVAARPGQGKSTLAQNIAENVVDRGGTAMFVSLEMSRRELAIRSLARASRIEGRRIQTGQLTEEQAQKHGQALPVIRDRTGLWVLDDGGMTIPKLRAEAARRKRQNGLSLLVVDYIQLMQGVGDTKALEVASISRGLKLLARSLDIPVMALSQMNRAIEARSEKRPHLSDLRDSGALEQDADVVIFLHDDANYDMDKTSDGKIEVIVEKNRKGPNGVVEMNFNKAAYRFLDNPKGRPA